MSWLSSVAVWTVPKNSDRTAAPAVDGTSSITSSPARTTARRDITGHLLLCTGTAYLDRIASAPEAMSVSWREALERAVGGLRLMVVPDEPGGRAEAAIASVAAGGVAPVEPEEPLDAPGPSLSEHQLERLSQHPLLALQALVEREAAATAVGPPS